MNAKELKLMNEWYKAQICGNKKCPICKSFIESYRELIIKLKGEKK